MDPSQADPFADHNEAIAAMMAQNSESTDEFQRLDVLAGAAQNATDIAIDPALTRDDLHSPTTTAPPSTSYYNDHEMSNYQPEPHWVYTTIPNPQSPVTTYEAYPNITTSPSDTMHYATGPFANPSMVTYTPINTVASDFITAPSTSFANGTQPLTQFVHETGNSTAPVQNNIPENKVRKAKEPYSQSKKAEVSNMRKIGACIRCSRLRKNCDPNRPCGQCAGTLKSKTWSGECTSLNKGHQFTLWYEGRLQQLSASILDQNISARLAEPFKGHLELAFFGEHGPKLLLNLLPVQSSQQLGATHITQYIIDDTKSVDQKLLDHANDNQKTIIEAADSSMIHATAWAVAGLSSPSEELPKNTVWGSGVQGERVLARIFDIWLATTLLMKNEFKPKMKIIASNGNPIDDSLLDPSYDMIALQINGALESVITKSEKEGVLHKFDANILSQSYKHLFDLVVGIVLILNAVEKYCSFIDRDNMLNDAEITEMVEQGTEMANVYTYCVKNIKMMPRLKSDGEGCLAACEDSERVDWSLQRGWIRDMFLNEAELVKLDLMGGGGESLEGSLVAGLFVAMIEE